MSASDPTASLKATDVPVWVEGVLQQAVRAQASDVHFNPEEAGLRVLFRLDGRLQEVDFLTGGLTGNVVTRLKVLADLLTYRNDVPQEGRLEVSGVDTGGVHDLRLSVFPTIHGERAVVRLIYRDQQRLRLDELGLPAEGLDLMHRYAAGHQGTLILTGPAGSGKSTTLAALMRWILETTPGRSVVTLEDPVEIRIDGAVQTQITAHGAMTFPTALRSVLRQDPQVVMIGEVRDAETARIAIEAGLTGHLVATTLHAGSPAAALLRLLEMGVEPYQVTSSVVAVVHQRLVRRFCPDCGGPAAATGCRTCLATGFRGRRLLAEVLPLDTPLRQALLAKADLETLEGLLIGRGHRDLWQHGLALVEQGLTSLEELRQTLGLPDSVDFNAGEVS